MSRWLMSRQLEIAWKDVLMGYIKILPRLPLGGDIMGYTASQFASSVEFDV
jgi:hypothetical protein